MSVAEDIKLNDTNAVEVSSRLFGVTAQGEEVFEHRIVNRNGVELCAIDFGAVITCVKTPDQFGNLRNIVLNYASIEDYERCQHYVGAVVGPIAGRIKGACFEANGKTIRLDQNENANCLHSGEIGLNKKVWRGKICKIGNEAAIEFLLSVSENETEYGAGMIVRVRYCLTEDNELQIEYEARAPSEIHINLTQHSYFNLSGNFQSSIGDHELRLDADSALAVDESNIPTGKYIDVANSKLDFRNTRNLASAAAWLDHDFVRPTGRAALWRAGSLMHPDSGRRLDVFTDQPSLHVYAGGKLGGNADGGFPVSSGLCLETQKFPNAPNNASFPTTKLVPGERYRHRTIYSFSVS